MLALAEKAPPADPSFFSGVLTWLPVLIGIVIFLGAAAVYLKGSKDKGTIETLSRNNDALMERVALLEKSEAELKARVTVVENENTVLRGLANSSAEIAALSESLSEHHTQAMEAWALLHTDLTNCKGKP